MMAIENFRQAMRALGIEPPPEITADGNLHRFYVAGDKRWSKNGWYILHGDYPRAGQFGCWKRGVSRPWSAKEFTSMTATERAIINARMDLMERKRAEEQGRVHTECRKRSAALWDWASLANDSHSYLQDKQIKAYGLKFLHGALLVPVRDLDGVLHGLQKIWRSGNGGKRFEMGTAVRGHFHPIGTADGDTFVICEGYATGASLHEATGLPVVVAFDGGNLKVVAEELRLKYPSRMLILAADNDKWTKGNPGMTKATEAAKAVGGLVVVPSFANTELRHTDFNDVHRTEGGEAVRLLFERQGVPCV